MRLRQALGGRIRHCHASGAARERGWRRLRRGGGGEQIQLPPPPSPPVVAAKKRDGGFAQATTVLGRTGVLGRGGSSATTVLGMTGVLRRGESGMDGPREGGSSAGRP
uniref:DUF834 domain-containing protein n=1 Tax=Oryza barthii TaxID=65489 RepID=A0A0D3FU95_9ORYZ